MVLILVQKEPSEGAPVPIEIDENEAIDVLCQLIEIELGISSQEQDIFVNGNRIAVAREAPVRTVFTEGCLATVKRAVQRNISIHDIRQDVPPDVLLRLCQEQPHLIEQFKSNDQELGGVLERGDLSALRMLLMKRHMEQHKVKAKRNRELADIEANPTSEESQRKIEEAIRQANVQQSMELAIENLPESFGRVHMLYVNLTVNDHPIKAFVDSGAQSTIMSARCAERCGLSRLVDSRFSGEARGVGTSRILGRIHIAQMKFGSSYFPISLTVLENNDVDFLFGLDMLKRYRCIIDLNRNVLRINTGTDGSAEELPFLGEGDIPLSFTGSGGESDNAKVGAVSSSGPPTTTESEESSSNSGNSGVTAGSGSQSAGNNTAVGGDEEKLNRLVAMGFDRSRASAALHSANGDVDLAATLLMESI